MTGFERTTRALEEGMAAGTHLGGQIYVSVDGEARFDEAFGEAAPGVPMTRGHRLLWLSATKPVTAIAIAQLWQEGRLGLDDAVHLHVPEFTGGGKDAITIRHLLTHTAGIRMLKIGWPEQAWDETLRAIYERKVEPRWEPGRKAGYHLQSSWFVLGEIVQRLDGRPFPEAVQARIFRPLGISDASIGMSPEEYEAARESIAPMWDTEDDPPARHDWDTEARVTRPAPGSNGYGPIRRLGRIYEALLAGGRLGGAEILAAPTAEAVTARHRVGMLDHTFQRKLDWGLGFILDSKHWGEERVPYGYGPHASPRTYGHSGYRATVAFGDPEHHLAVAVGWNGTPSEEDHQSRVERTLAAIYEDLALSAQEKSRPEAGFR